ncbi:uncharacterized protein LOC135220270 [Macrobrachium nipponense]|uniref:uncharacterized protein LOC135220270 n=1 Tax=Macrobrachium nipponense TaxID=159736 RepID=UPI0030C89174
MVGAGKPKRRSGGKKQKKVAKMPTKNPKGTPLTSFDGVDLTLGKDGCIGTVRVFRHRDMKVGAGERTKDIAGNCLGSYAGFGKDDEGSNQGDLSDHVDFGESGNWLLSTPRGSMGGNLGTVPKPVGSLLDNVGDATRPHGNSRLVSEHNSVVPRNLGTKTGNFLHFKEGATSRASGSMRENLNEVINSAGSVKRSLSAVPKPGEFVQSNLAALSSSDGFVHCNLDALPRPTCRVQGKLKNGLPAMSTPCSVGDRQVDVGSNRKTVDNQKNLSTLQNNLGIVFRNCDPAQANSVGGFPKRSGSERDELRKLAHCGNFSLSRKKSMESDTNKGSGRKNKETITSSAEDDDDDDISLSGLASILKDYRPEDHDDDVDDEGFIMVRRRGRRAKRDVTLTLDEGSGRGATSEGGNNNNNDRTFASDKGKGSIVYCRKVISCEEDDTFPDDDISLKSLASILKDYRPEDHDNIADNEEESDARGGGGFSWVDLDDEDELRALSRRSSLTPEQKASLRKAAEEEDVSAEKDGSMLQSV